MKVALVCEHGGHLTELLYIIHSLEKYDIFFISNKNIRTYSLNYKRYLINSIGTNFFRAIKALITINKIIIKETPDVIISTGAEIAIPTFLIAYLYGVKTIFIESWCRVYTPSNTGRIVYYLSDIFLVQWPQLLKKYGSKATYQGSVF